MSTASAVPMNPEGFFAMIARHTRTWGRKAISMAKKPGKLVARAANWLHVTQATRWVASKTTFVASKVWHVVKIPVLWGGPAVVAVLYAPQFVAVMLLGLTFSTAVMGFWLWRLHKKLKEQAPEETRALIEDLRRRLAEAQEEAREAKKTPAPEPEKEPEKEPETETVVVEEVHTITDVIQRHPVDTGEQDRSKESAQQPFPPEPSKDLPVPYGILNKRWLGLSEQADEARDAEDNDLYSEVIGRMSVVLVRTGDPGNKLLPDTPWNKIHTENRKALEIKEPDREWNWTRMSNGAKAEAKLLREMAEKAQVDEAA